MNREEHNEEEESQNLDTLKAEGQDMALPGKNVSGCRVFAVVSFLRDLRALRGYPLFNLRSSV